MQYVIQVVGEDELPEGVNRLIVEREGRPPLMLINGEPASCWRFMRAWEASQDARAVPSVLLPAWPLLYAV